jgi:hypothetical protein
MDASKIFLLQEQHFPAGNNIVILKINSARTQQWVYIYSSPGNYNDAVNSMAIDNTSSVITTGYTNYPSGTYGDCLTLKVNAGTLQWSALYNGPANLSDNASSVALDNSNNVFITGSSGATGSGSDYITIKYSPAGVQQWTARYNGTDNNNDIALDIAVDPVGNSYITGWSFGNGSPNYTTVKYNTTGMQQWVARLLSNSPSQAQSIAIDVLGNVYITGWASTAPKSYDFATIKYNQPRDTAHFNRNPFFVQIIPKLPKPF